MSALEDLKARQDEAVKSGKCACLCGERLPTRVVKGEIVLRHARQRHIDEAHRRKAYDDRQDVIAAGRGLQTRGRRMLVSGLRGSRPTSDRRSDAESRRQPRQTRHRDGVSVYLSTSEKAKTVVRDIRAYLAGIQDDLPELAEHANAIDRALARRRAREEKAAA